MAAETSVKTKKSLWTRWRIFRHSRPLLSWLVILGVVVIFFMVAGGVGFVTYDYTQNNPKFCITCHQIMIESYETWQKSEHAEINCHSCHALTPDVVKSHSIALLTGMPEKVPPRPEGKIIVPDKQCMTCHWEVNKQHGDPGEWYALMFPEHPAPEKSSKVSNSRFHALHYFMGPTACVTCHGEKRLHQFATAPEDCLTCHKDQQEQAHAAKSVELACLNCHTDRTADLSPDREKCRACHGENNAAVQQQLAEAGTLDVKYAQPTNEIVTQAKKITVAANAPMQSLNCDTCHQPHQENAAPSQETCINCHPSITEVGQHALHLNFVGGDCLACHQPHSWKITEEQAQEECSKCHEYYEPVKFIQALKE